MSDLAAAVLQGVVTVGDYDGVVAQVHIASGHLVADVDEHDGRRCAGPSPALRRSDACLPLCTPCGRPAMWPLACFIHALMCHNPSLP